MIDETYLSINDAIGELKAMREHIVGYMSVVGTTAYDMGIEALEAQPCIEDYPTCTECEHYDKEKHYCPRFCQVIKDTLAEAQPCEDCISRQAVIDYAKDTCLDLDKYEDTEVFCDEIKYMPSVTPQRPKGKWIGVSPISYICSCCSYGVGRWNNTPYCPNCGAEMSGGGEDEVSD